LDAVAGSATAWRRNPHAVSRVTPRSVVVSLGLDTDTIKLEGFAAVVWEALAEPATEDELDARLVRRTASAPAEPADAIADALQTLVAASAIEHGDD
jgi:hypothetical protein